MAQKIILGIRMNNRNRCAVNVQDILTKHGCCIRTRVGLHEVSDDVCSPSGTILLEMHGTIENIQALEDALISCEGLVLQKMVFEG